MTAELGPLGILGGAFDPVHFGHLRCAIEVRDELELSEVVLLPSANPPHRAPHFASASQRLEMLEAALHELSDFRVDTRELDRDGPSWSVLSLQELRASYPGRSLAMILGMDAFLGLPNWHRWEEILELTNICVARRPGSSLPVDGPIADLLAAARVTNPREVAERPAGSIYICEITQLDISSTQIRALLARGGDARFLLPNRVLDSITESACYSHPKQE